MTLVSNPLETLDYVTALGIGSPAAETAILSTDVVQAYANPADQQPGSETIPPQTIRPVIVEANLNVLAGTSATAIVVRCRQGVGTGGAQVGPSYTHSLAAGSIAQLQCKFRDSTGVPFAPGGTAYTVTVAQTSGTVAGTVNNIDIEVKQ